MSLNALRLIFVIGVLLVMAMYGTIVQLADWQHLPPDVMKNSPDAPLMIARLQTQVGFLGGLCMGMGLCMGIAAFVQRGQIYEASFIIKAHWAAQALPSLIVIGILAAR